MEREGAEPARILAHAWITSDFFMIAPRAKSQPRLVSHESTGRIRNEPSSVPGRRERDQTRMGRLYRHSARLERGTASEEAVKLHAFATVGGSPSSKTSDSHLRTVRRRVTFCRRCCRSTRTSEEIVRSERRLSSKSWPPRRNLSNCQKYSVHGITKIRMAVNRMSKRPPRAYP